MTPIPTPSVLGDRSRTDVFGDVCRITLVARSTGELFETDSPLPPEYLPLDASVLDFLTDTVRRNAKTCERFELIVVAPLDAFGDVKPFVDEKRLTEALRNYFLSRSDRIARQLSEYFQDARSMLIYGLIFMLACTLLRTALEPTEIHPFMSSVREGLLVIGWVALWKPIEELLFNWWPLRRELGYCRKLAEMDMRVAVTP